MAIIIQMVEVNAWYDKKSSEADKYLNLGQALYTNTYRLIIIDNW